MRFALSVSVHASRPYTVTLKQCKQATQPWTCFGSGRTWIVIATLGYRASPQLPTTPLSPLTRPRMPPSVFVFFPPPSPTRPSVRRPLAVTDTPPLRVPSTSSEESLARRDLTRAIGAGAGGLPVTTLGVLAPLLAISPPSLPLPSSPSSPSLPSSPSSSSFPSSPSLPSSPSRP